MSYPDVVAEARARWKAAEEWSSGAPYEDDPDLLRGLLEHIKGLEDALREIADLGDVRADEAPAIAKRALAGWQRCQ